MIKAWAIVNKKTGDIDLRIRSMKTNQYTIIDRGNRDNVNSKHEEIMPVYILTEAEAEKHGIGGEK